MSEISIAKHGLFMGALVMAFAMPAQAQLESALRAATQSTAASAASQQRVEKADDDAESMLREYRAVLQQKDNIQLFVDKQDIYLNSQNSEIASLNKQLANVENIKRGMIPMMLQMTVALQDSIENDMPFLKEERQDRIDRLVKVLADPEISPAEQYRQILNAYKIEVSYGQGIDSYEAPHPSKDNIKVDYLRYGRVSFVYMTKDEQEVAFYDMDKKDWVELGGDTANDVRKAIRVANKESAPEIVMAPVIVEN